MIKFIVAGLWLCAATIGAVVYSFQSAGEKATVEKPAPLLGGLDYVKTEVLSIPVMKDGGVEGYFLTRLVYTVDPEKVKKLSVPADVLFSDELYTYVFGNPKLDFGDVTTLDIDTLRKDVREKINARVGEELLHDVMIDQIDFLSKKEIRDNAVRRRVTAAEQAGADAAPGDQPAPGAGGDAQPAAHEEPAGH